MQKKQALRPEFFSNLPTVIKEQQAKEKGLTGDEQAYLALSQHEGWKLLKEYIDSLLRDLDQGTATAMAQGLPFEEIGRNAVVIDLAKGIIRNIVNKVQDAKEAAESGIGK